MTFKDHGFWVLLLDFLYHHKLIRVEVSGRGCFGVFKCNIAIAWFGSSKKTPQDLTFCSWLSRLSSWFRHPRLRNMNTMTKGTVFWPTFFFSRETEKNFLCCFLLSWEVTPLKRKVLRDYSLTSSLQYKWTRKLSSVQLLMRDLNQGHEPAERYRREAHHGHCIRGREQMLAVNQKIWGRAKRNQQN